ncbi:DegT/DnrJ/EryC1/StrS family aminotransferase [Brachybacterium alimentarium]|uniref:DegT/DnrJ/EryC1/StrS family aminotransferase n=1 Tax=Brachybacterium alimentarium TaxID=47845 RepID=UPI003FD22163
MTERLPLSSPDVGDAEEQALIKAFRSGWIAPVGPDLNAFESELAAFNDRTHCVGLASGSAALHLGLLTLGVRPGDAVLTSSMTFAATANAITYTGAEPVFIDSDSTGSINVDLLAQAAEELTAEGRKIGAIVPVDLLGKIVDHKAIAEVATRHDVPILSDAAESVGATRYGMPAGAFGTAAAVSFNGNKIMTTSGGGALLTDDADLAEQARYLSTQARQPVLHYEHTDIGYNYRLSNLLAALGRAQLRRLPGMIERRHQIRDTYRSLFASLDGVELFGEPDTSSQDGTRDNAWLTSIVVDPVRTGWTRDELLQHLAKHQIEARPLWKPMHLQPVFSESRKFTDGTSQRFFKTGLSLPSGSANDNEQIARVTCAIREFTEARR